MADGIHKYVAKEMTSKFILLGVFTLLISHILACIFLATERAAIPDGATTKSSESLLDRYIDTLYFLISTSTSVGYGDITINHKLENLVIFRYSYQIFIMLFSVLSTGAFYTVINGMVKGAGDNVQKITKEVEIGEGSWSNLTSGCC